MHKPGTPQSEGSMLHLHHAPAPQPWILPKKIKKYPKCRLYDGNSPVVTRGQPPHSFSGYMLGSCQSRLPHNWCLKCWTRSGHCIHSLQQVMVPLIWFPRSIVGRVLANTGLTSMAAAQCNWYMCGVPLPANNTWHLAPAPWPRACLKKKIKNPKCHGFG